MTNPFTTVGYTNTFGGAPTNWPWVGATGWNTPWQNTAWPNTTPFGATPWTCGQCTTNGYTPAINGFTGFTPATNGTPTFGFTPTTPGFNPAVNGFNPTTNWNAPGFTPFGTAPAFGATPWNTVGTTPGTTPGTFPGATPWNTNWNTPWNTAPFAGAFNPGWNTNWNTTPFGATPWNGFFGGNTTPFTNSFNPFWNTTPFGASAPFGWTTPWGGTVNPFATFGATPWNTGAAGFNPYATPNFGPFGVPNFATTNGFTGYPQGVTPGTMPGTTPNGQWTTTPYGHGQPVGGQTYPQGTNGTFPVIIDGNEKTQKRTQVGHAAA